MKAVVIFKDLLSFLTAIPVGTRDESYLQTSARYMFLFPLIGTLLGLLAAGYYHLCLLILSSLSAFLEKIFAPAWEIFSRIFLTGATLSFLFTLTGLQHFDGLIDLGNAIGLKSIKKRLSAAHAWIVTRRGALLAFIIEFLSFFGLFIVSPTNAATAIICSETLAKLAMVTVAWFGKPAYKGLGSLFASHNRKKAINVLSYLITLLVVYPLVGILNSLILLVMCFSLGFIMEKISEVTFGGTSGDVIGSTNEIMRAISLIAFGLVIK